MLQTIFIPLLLILLVLTLGWLIGIKLPFTIKQPLTKLITPLIWLILICIGKEFAKNIDELQSINNIIGVAGIYYALVVLMPFFIIAILEAKLQSKSKSINTTIINWLYIRNIAFDLFTVFLMLSLGVIYHWLTAYFPIIANCLPSMQLLLLFMLFFVGISFTTLKISKQWLNWNTLLLPILVIALSCCGGLMAGWINNDASFIALTLASGLGWFSLSTPLVTQNLGQHYGTIVLIVDLARELTAIILIYAVGKNYPNSVIALGAATTMDNTLPMIEQTCGPKHMPTALVSGLILTLSAPFLMTFWITMLNLN